MTLPGIDMVVAVGLMTAIGRIGQASRLHRPQSERPAIGWRPDSPRTECQAGRSNARHLLVEAAWQAVRAPGPLRAFYERVRARRGNHVAALAVARKLVVLIWHMLSKGEDYAWIRPALMARKMRATGARGRAAGSTGSARHIL